MRAKSPTKTTSETSSERPSSKVFSLLFGVFLGLSLLKFGNPCLFDDLVSTPADFMEWSLNNWPIRIAYWLLAGLGITGLFASQSRVRSPRWVFYLPVAWLGWQFVSATQTIDPDLTRVTLYHFTASVICFYLGAFCLSRQPALLFWVPILCSMLVVIARGLEQHFGGLEETRRYFNTYIYPMLGSVPPEYLKRMSSDRIFSTLFYPNALAGAVLLMLPPTLLVVWRISTRFTFPARSFLTATYAAGALGCLFWSGSKAGWLLAVLAGLIVLLHLPIALRLKISLVAAIALLGLSGFVWRYSGYFDRGAASVHARFDYWRAATETMISKPVLGSGPGTFGIAYKAIKRPESEMARLAHNDFLQQGSDSGVIGFLTYLAWVCGIVWFGRPRFGNRRITFQLVVWLGVLGFCLQGIAEFGLYIPALAWPAFAMSGWILNSEAEPIRVSSETSRNQVIATVTLSDGRSPV